MKKNLSGDIATDLLSSALRVRFLELFSVALRKSVFAWREAALSRARVLVLDASAGHIEQPAHWMRASNWVGRWPPDYTVANLHAPDALESTSTLLHETAAAPLPPVTLVPSAREASQEQIEALAAGLIAVGHDVVSVVPVDVRDRNQMLQALGVLVTMLSLRNESL